jgi:hypothetical protein
MAAPTHGGTHKPRTPQPRQAAAGRLGATRAHACRLCHSLTQRLGFAALAAPAPAPARGPSPSSSSCQVSWGNTSTCVAHTQARRQARGAELECHQHPCMRSSPHTPAHPAPLRAHECTHLRDLPPSAGPRPGLVASICTTGGLSASPGEAKRGADGAKGITARGAGGSVAGGTAGVSGGSVAGRTAGVTSGGGGGCHRLLLRDLHIRGLP